MTTDAEIMELWRSISKKNPADNASIIALYRHAEAEGAKKGIADLDAALQSDTIIEGAMKTFGFGRRSKAAIITERAIVREMLHLASERAQKANCMVQTPHGKAQK